MLSDPKEYELRHQVQFVDKLGDGKDVDVFETIEKTGRQIRVLHVSAVKLNSLLRQIVQMINQHPQSAVVASVEGED